MSSFIETHFSTSDLGLACVCCTLGFPVEALDASNRSRVEFVFKRTNGLDELVQAYYAKELQVEPQAFFSNLKILKSRIYSS